MVPIRKKESKKGKSKDKVTSKGPNVPEPDGQLVDQVSKALTEGLQKRREGATKAESTPTKEVSQPKVEGGEKEEEKLVETVTKMIGKTSWSSGIPADLRSGSDANKGEEKKEEKPPEPVPPENVVIREGTVPTEKEVRKIEKRGKREEKKRQKKEMRAYEKKMKELQKERRRLEKEAEEEEREAREEAAWDMRCFAHLEKQLKKGKDKREAIKQEYEGIIKKSKEWNIEYFATLNKMDVTDISLRERYNEAIAAYKAIVELRNDLKEFKDLAKQMKKGVYVVDELTKKQREIKKKAEENPHYLTAVGGESNLAGLEYRYYEAFNDYERATAVVELNGRKVINYLVTALITAVTSAVVIVALIVNTVVQNIHIKNLKNKVKETDERVSVVARNEAIIRNDFEVNRNAINQKLLVMTDEINKEAEERANADERILEIIKGRATGKPGAKQPPKKKKGFLKSILEKLGFDGRSKETVKEMREEVKRGREERKK